MKTTFAQIFNDWGIKLLPCYPRSKQILKNYGPYKRGVTDFATFSSYLIGGGNYALATGTGSAWGHEGGGGLVVLDFDDIELYRQFTNNKQPDTFTVRTARGFHVYFFADDVRSFSFDGLDILGKNKFCMGAYSVHPSGAVYEPINQPSIKRIESAISDFSLLSKKLSSKKLPQPPKVAPKSLRSGGNNNGKVAAIKRLLPILEAMKIFQPKAAKTIKGAGRWRQYNCAFHKDKHRSGWIDTERNLVGCHACNFQTTDVIGLVALSKNISNRDAIKLLGGAL